MASLARSMTRKLTRKPGRALAYDSFNLDAFLASLTDGFRYNTRRTERFFQEPMGFNLADDIGETMGLALDQRMWGGKTRAQVIAAQPEIAANGNFAVDANWTKTQATIAGGKATIATPDGSYAAIIQAFATVVGRLYRVSVDVDSVTGSLAICAPSGQVLVTVTTPSTYAVYFFATATTSTLELKRGNAGVPATITLDNVSIKEIPGKHAVQTGASTLRPTRQASGAKFDGNDDNWLAGYTAGAGQNFIVALVEFPASVGGTQIVAGAASGASNVDRFYFGVTTAGALRLAVGSASALDSTGLDLRGRQAVVGMSTDGTTVKGFADSAEAHSSPFAGVMSNIGFRIGSGNFGGNGTGYFGGTIIDIASGQGPGAFLDLAKFNQIAAAMLANQ